MGVPKKKRWADDGRRWAMCPSNKKKEDGRPPPKKKMGKHPSLLSYFLAPVFCLNISFFSQPPKPLSLFEIGGG